MGTTKNGKDEAAATSTETNWMGKLKAGKARPAHSAYRRDDSGDRSLAPLALLSKNESVSARCRATESRSIPTHAHYLQELATKSGCRRAGDGAYIDDRSLSKFCSLRFHPWRVHVAAPRNCVDTWNNRLGIRTAQNDGPRLLRRSPSSAYLQRHLAAN